jgi:hypothetical protein
VTTETRVILPINDDDTLFRRIAPDFVKKDGSISTSAFKTNRVPDNEISLELEALSNPEQCANRGKTPGFAVGRLVARLPRMLGFDVYHDPLPNAEYPDLNNYAHCLATGENDEEKCKRLALGTTICLAAISRKPS